MLYYGVLICSKRKTGKFRNFSCKYFVTGYEHSCRFISN